jgi:hypothetical protein
MGALDGNAIGGLLIEVFGMDMTAAPSTCGTCGASRRVAELAVYGPAPGTVVRCRTCDSVLMVNARGARPGLRGPVRTRQPGLTRPRRAGVRRPGYS